MNNPFCSGQYRNRVDDLHGAMILEIAGKLYFHLMRKSFRYVLYVVVGFMIYQIIDSGETTYTHSEVKNTLIIAMIVVFVLLIVVRIAKQRYEDDDKS